MVFTIGVPEMIIALVAFLVIFFPERIGLAAKRAREFVLGHFRGLRDRDEYEKRYKR